jgi:hypothetical protein
VEVTVAVPLIVPDVAAGTLSVATTAPFTPEGAIWMCAAVAEALRPANEMVYATVVDDVTVICAVPVPEDAFGGTSAAPLRAALEIVCAYAPGIESTSANIAPASALASANLQPRRPRISPLDVFHAY